MLSDVINDVKLFLQDILLQFFGDIQSDVAFQNKVH